MLKGLKERLMLGKVEKVQNVCKDEKFICYEKVFLWVKGSNGSDCFFLNFKNFLQWGRFSGLLTTRIVHIFVSSSGLFRNWKQLDNRLSKVESGYFLV